MGVGRDELSLSSPRSLLDCDSVTKYTWEEVHNHRAANDCWMVIEGKVYDFTSWVPKHPGGQLIMNGAGRDATPLFYSYHALHVQAMLPKYLIGEIENYKPYYNWQTDFYVTLKRRVEEVQKRENLKKDSKEMFLKTFLLLALWAMSWYFTFKTASIFAAMVFGIFHGHIGIQIAHDGNHGSYSRKPWLSTMAACTMDMIGASSMNWEMQHNVGHHPNSNRKGDYYSEDYDPDVKSGYPLIRLTPNHKWLPHHRFQHFYIWFLFAFVALKWLYGDFRSIVQQRYQAFEYWKLTNFDFAYALFTKAVFFGYTIGTFSYAHGLWTGWWLFFFFLATQSYVFIFMFAVNHLTEDTQFPHENSEERDWAKLQILTSSNFGLDNKFWLWFSGGLNYQIEHHLFPSICHMYLPYISPVVRQTCKEFNVPYSSFNSYFDALRSYYIHVRNLGTQTEEQVQKTD